MSTTKELVAALEKLILVDSSRDEMYSLCEELFRSASREADHDGMMVSDFYYANYYYFYEHNLEKANQYINSCISEASAFNADEYLMKSLCMSSLISIGGYKPYSATETVLKALRIAEASKDDVIKAIIQNVLGNIFALLNDYDEANRYFQDAKNSFEKNNFHSDYLCYKVLLDYILNSMNLEKYELLDSSINFGLMKFNQTPLAVTFKALRDIISLFKRLSYIERSIVDDIYSLFLSVEDIKRDFDKARVLITMYPLVERTEDYQLFKEYVELLEAYSYDLTEIYILDKAAEIKLNLLGAEDLQLDYIDFESKKNDLLQTALDKAIKSMIYLNEASIERDSEIEKNKTLMRISSIDELTKLYNRRQGVSLIEEALQDVTKPAYAFIMIDVDDFKSINDTYGHGTGDSALIFISKALKEMFDKDSIVVRLAGDEFVVLLYNLPTDLPIRRSVVLYKLDLLNKYLEETKLDFLDGNTMSVSMGVTLEGDSFDSLYSNADVALYESKYSGKSKYSVFGDNEAKKEE